VQPEGLGKLKKITPSCIEPTAFRLVAQSLNHYAIACPQVKINIRIKEMKGIVQYGV
jgi:hypothetical protein